MNFKNIKKIFEVAWKIWSIVSLLLLILLLRRKQNPSLQPVVDKDREMNAEYAYRALKLIQYLVPKDVFEKGLVRVGHPHEGGYSMLDDFENISVAYSVGIGGDWSFDSGLSSRGIQVFMFDHTIPQPALNDPLLKFYKYGIDHKIDVKHNLLTLRDMLELDNNADEGNMILKMDVEGSEWEILLKSDELNQFSRIVLELHWFKDIILSKERYLIALSALKKLNHTHQLVWVHGITQNWVPTTNLNFGGVPLTDQIEVSYVRRDKKYKFVDHDTKKKRVNEINYPGWTETLMWWVEGGNIDFEGLLKFYKEIILDPVNSVAFNEEVNLQ